MWNNDLCYKLIYRNGRAVEKFSDNNMSEAF